MKPYILYSRAGAFSRPAFLIASLRSPPRGRDRRTPSLPKPLSSGRPTFPPPKSVSSRAERSEVEGSTHLPPARQTFGTKILRLRASHDPQDDSPQGGLPMRAKCPASRYIPDPLGNVSLCQYPGGETPPLRVLSIQRRMIVHHRRGRVARPVFRSAQWNESKAPL